MRLGTGHVSAFTAVEARYQAELKAQAELLAVCREENEFLRQQIQSLQEIIKTMAQNGPQNRTNTYNLQNAHFEGGFAETVHGHQIGSIQSPRPHNTS